jgi:hypothetical protein
MLKVQRHMSHPKLIELYNFQANLSWSNGPFKGIVSQIYELWSPCKHLPLVPDL